MVPILNWQTSAEDQTPPYKRRLPADWLDRTGNTYVMSKRTWLTELLKSHSGTAEMNELHLFFSLCHASQK